MTDEKELGKAIKNGEDTIEVEFDLARKVIRIKATGKIAWGVAIASLGVAIGSVISIPSTGGTSTPIAAPLGLVGLGASASVLGVSVATSAVAIGAAGGGIATLNKLRNYRMEKINDDKIILHKKQ